jgi:hypothetical protein
MRQMCFLLPCASIKHDRSVTYLMPLFLRVVSHALFVDYQLIR